MTDPSAEFYRYKKSVCLPGDMYIDTLESKLNVTQINYRVPDDGPLSDINIQISTVDKNYVVNFFPHKIGSVQKYLFSYKEPDSGIKIAWNPLIKNIQGENFHAIKSVLFDFLKDGDEAINIILPFDPVNGIFVTFLIEPENNMLKFSAPIKDVIYPIINFTKETFNLRLVLNEYIVLWNSLASQISKDILWKTATEFDKWFIINHDITYQESLNQGNLNRMTSLP